MSTIEKKVNALVRLALTEDEDEREYLLQSLRKMMNGDVAVPKVITEVSEPLSYPERIYNALLELGVPNHIKGHRFVCYAIELVINNPDYIDNVTKAIYPMVAMKFDTTPSRVERAVRHAIEATWDRADFDVIAKYFGNTISPNKGKPTNSEFIARMANALR